jgi:hypothetical protein
MLFKSSLLASAPACLTSAFMRLILWPWRWRWHCTTLDGLHGVLFQANSTFQHMYDFWQLHTEAGNLIKHESLCGWRQALPPIANNQNVCNSNLPWQVQQVQSCHALTEDMSNFYSYTHYSPLSDISYKPNDMVIPARPDFPISQKRRGVQRRLLSDQTTFLSYH